MSFFLDDQSPESRRASVPQSAAPLSDDGDSDSSRSLSPVQPVPPPPRRSRYEVGIVAAWNRRIANAMQVITDRNIREQKIDVQDVGEDGLTPAQARVNKLINSLDEVLNVVNAENIPHSTPLTDGEPKIDIVQAQNYQFFCVKVPPQNMGNKVVRISLDAIEGDPDLFACVEEFPTSERNTWKSAGEGDDKIDIPPPHATNTYYIGVFGYYQSEFKISFNLVDEAIQRRERTALNQREALIESVQNRMDEMKLDDNFAKNVERDRLRRPLKAVLASKNATIHTIATPLSPRNPKHLKPTKPIPENRLPQPPPLNRRASLLSEAPASVQSYFFVVPEAQKSDEEVLSVLSHRGVSLFDLDSRQVIDSMPDALYRRAFMLVRTASTAARALCASWKDRSLHLKRLRTREAERRQLSAHRSTSPSRGSAHDRTPAELRWPYVPDQPVHRQSSPTKIVPKPTALVPAPPPPASSPRAPTHAWEIPRSLAHLSAAAIDALWLSLLADCFDRAIFRSQPSTGLSAYHPPDRLSEQFLWPRRLELESNSLSLARLAPPQIRRRARSEAEPVVASAPVPNAVQKPVQPSGRRGSIAGRRGSVLVTNAQSVAALIAAIEEQQRLDAQQEEDQDDEDAENDDIASAVVIVPDRDQTGGNSFAMPSLGHLSVGSSIGDASLPYRIDESQSFCSARALSRMIDFALLLAYNSHATARRDNLTDKSHRSPNSSISASPQLRPTSALSPPGSPRLGPQKAEPVKSVAPLHAHLPPFLMNSSPAALIHSVQVATRRMGFVVTGGSPSLPALSQRFEALEVVRRVLREAVAVVVDTCVHKDDVKTIEEHDENVPAAELERRENIRLRSLIMCVDKWRILIALSARTEHLQQRLKEARASRGSLPNSPRRTMSQLTPSLMPHAPVNRPVVPPLRLARHASVVSTFSALVEDEETAAAVYPEIPSLTVLQTNPAFKKARERNLHADWTQYLRDGGALLGGLASHRGPAWRSSASAPHAPAVKVRVPASADAVAQPALASSTPTTAIPLLSARLRAEAAAQAAAVNAERQAVRQAKADRIAQERAAQAERQAEQEAQARRERRVAYLKRQQELEALRSRPPSAAHSVNKAEAERLAAEQAAADALAAAAAAQKQKESEPDPYATPTFDYNAAKALPAWRVALDAQLASTASVPEEVTEPTGKKRSNLKLPSFVSEDESVWRERWNAMDANAMRSKLNTMVDRLTQGNGSADEFSDIDSTMHRIFTDDQRQSGTAWSARQHRASTSIAAAPLQEQFAFASARGRQVSRQLYNAQALLTDAQVREQRNQILFNSRLRRVGDNSSSGGSEANALPIVSRQPRRKPL